MKKIILLLMLIGMISCTVGCGSQPAEEIATEEPTTEKTTEEPTTEEETFPEYKTMKLTPSELVEKINTDSTITFSTKYTTADNGDGTSDFEMSEKVLGVKYSGTLENKSQKIIDLSGILELDDNQKENDKLVTAVWGVTTLSEAIIYLFDKTPEEAREILIQASGSESLRYDMEEYAILTLGFGAGMPIMFILPKEENLDEDSSDGVVGDNNHDGVVDDEDWEIEWKDYINDKLKELN